jgi:hypothetical protein
VSDKTGTHNAVIYNQRADKFWSGKAWVDLAMHAKPYRPESAQSIIRLAQVADQGERDGTRTPVSEQWSDLQRQLAHSNVITNYGQRDEAIIMVSYADTRKRALA